MFTSGKKRLHEAERMIPPLAAIPLGRIPSNKLRSLPGYWTSSTSALPLFSAFDISCLFVLTTVKNNMALMTKRKLFLFRCHKIRPDQAGFFRRFFAFAVDSIIIIILAFMVYLFYIEITAAFKKEPGLVAKAIHALKEGGPFLITTESQEVDEFLKKVYLQELKKSLPPEEYKRAKEMTFQEMKQVYRLGGKFENLEDKIIKAGKGINILREIVVAYLYFGLFFRLRSQTPGKRLLRLKVVDLSGRPRLGWYQSFERAHGYAASALFASLGFLQVLWDSEGLTMHDKIASTTVIKLPRKKRERAKRGPKKIAKNQPESNDA
jgi:hypothetical protein